jgi:RNA polymerase sigma-70 factor (ECF subfamily)
MVRVAQGGDRDAFEQLVRRWDGRIFGYLVKSGGDREAAEDVRQEVFLRVFRYARSYDPRYAFSTWIYRIASNALKTWRSRRGPSEATVPISRNGASPPEPVDPDPDPRQRAAADQIEERVRKAIDDLEVDERELLLLRFDRGLSFREIAEIQEAPETTVKSRFYAALNRLRRPIERLGLNERT